MHLIQILLPLVGDDDQPFTAEKYERIAQELTERFGGVTSFTRSPAEGRWTQDRHTEHDEIVVIEVMTEELDRDWWSGLRQRLMRDFQQDDVVIRSQLLSACKDRWHGNVVEKA